MISPAFSKAVYKSFDVYSEIQLFCTKIHNTFSVKFLLIFSIFWNILKM